MLRRGVYSRMHDGNKQKRFRNEAQIEVRDDCIIYSTSAVVGQAKRTVLLPIEWQGVRSFIVNWSRVCRHWSNAAIFRAHAEHGVEGLAEQARHFWRYEGPAAQTIQDNQGSHQARKSLLFLSCAFGLRPDTQRDGALLYNMHGQLEVL